MSEQKHLIKRQLIELTVPRRASATAIQDQASRIYRERIVPLIAQYCSELSSPDRLHRIDTLELDLGTLDGHDLETQMVAQVSTRLYNALAKQIHHLDQVNGTGANSPKALSALELFGLFVSTGNLPWWADHGNASLLADTLQQLLDAGSSAFRQLLQELAHDHGMRQRLASHYADQQLAQMLAVLMPALAPALLQQTPVLIAALQKTPCGRTWSASRQRQALWGHCLQVAALGGQHYPALAAFYQAVLERFAMESGINLGVLMADMAQVLQSGQVANSQPLQATLAAQHGSAPAPARVNPALAQALIRLQRGSAGALLAAWSQLRAQLAGLSASLQAQLPQALAGKQQQAAAQVLALLQQNHPMPQPKPLPELVRLFEIALADSNQPESELAACLRRLQSHGGPLNEVWSALRAICWQLPAPAQHNWLAALSGAAAAQFDAASALSRLLAGPQSSHGLRAEACARLQHMLHNDAGAAQARQNRFAAVEELSVGNAGLVILWPFLSSFFAHLGLLEENNFKDLAARQRAVGLLQLLAAEESSFPEYLLPLNKVLCGLELQHPFGFGPPPKKREIRECSQLLAAVIAQAPILNNMSEAGFRGSFLLRPGLLSRRDGHWLLRVERQTYDIVLERFPWSWSWVKLPWMADPLRVEW